MKDEGGNCSIRWTSLPKLAGVSQHHRPTYSRSKAFNSSGRRSGSNSLRRRGLEFRRYRVSVSPPMNPATCCQRSVSSNRATVTGESPQERSSAIATFSPGERGRAGLPAHHRSLFSAASKYPRGATALRRARESTTPSPEPAAEKGGVSASRCESFWDRHAP